MDELVLVCKVGKIRDSRGKSLKKIEILNFSVGVINIHCPVEREEGESEEFSTYVCLYVFSSYMMFDNHFSLT